jgi:hypothetical protein
MGENILPEKLGGEFAGKKIRLFAGEQTGESFSTCPKLT